MKICLLTFLFQLFLSEIFALDGKIAETLDANCLPLPKKKDQKSHTVIVASIRWYFTAFPKEF